MPKLQQSVHYGIAALAGLLLSLAPASAQVVVPTETTPAETVELDDGTVGSDTDDQARAPRVVLAMSTAPASSSFLMTVAVSSIS